MRRDIQKRFERRMEVIFRGRIYEDDVTLAIEEAVNDEFLAVKD
jgi:hypothetical protein